MMSRMEMPMRRVTLGLCLLLLGACTGTGKAVSPDDTDETDTVVDDTDVVDTDVVDTDPTDTIDTDPGDDTDTDLLDTDTDVDTDDTFGADTFAPDTGSTIPSDTGDTGGGGGPGAGPGGPGPDEGCPPLQELDCEGICGNTLLLGDGVCHDGLLPGTPNFDCEQFDNDDGDCQSDTDSLPCGDPLELRDCVGTCYRQTFIGDGSCDDGSPHPWGDPNFNCALFGEDGGDCQLIP